jgi:methylenetetrahydrofolate dehydrogenase (NADP+)/methenyltetrahydrofolate cyclohydrolase/formyltetrahydrofolate synthetase
MLVTLDCLIDKCITSSSDTPAEIALVQQASKTAGAFDAIVCEHWAKGGIGAVALGDAVIRACAQPSKFK